MAPLSPILETVERAMSRGYEALPTPTICTTSCSRTDVDIHIIRPNDETPIESVFVPSATIKRYVFIYVLVQLLSVIIESVGIGMGHYGAPSFIVF